MMKRILTLAALLVFFCVTTQAATLKDLSLPDKLPAGWTLEATAKPDVFNLTIPSEDGVLTGILEKQKNVKRSTFSADDLRKPIISAGKQVMQGYHIINPTDYFSQESSEYKNNVLARQIRFFLSQDKDNNVRLWGQMLTFYYKDDVYAMFLTSTKNHTEDFAHEFMTTVFGSEKKRRFDFDNHSFEY